MTEYERREYIVLYECDGDTMFDMGTKERIVRCKDCKFRCFDECTRIDDGFKDYWFAIDLDGFCAWAKRKEVD